MSKISQYLNEHLMGEVTDNKSVLDQFSRDGSILTLKPELIISPRVTNDIRKVARFAWQLAEKGHKMSITVRGGGTDQTGASIGNGIIINTLAHLNNIIFINLKDKDQFVHCQPGTNFGTLNEALKSHGIIVPNYPSSVNYSTIGGAIANNAAGPSGAIADYVKRLEVVLSNGDVIETSRISRRDLDKKKGLETFEGEIYRKIDAIVEDNDQFITDKITPKTRENTGFSGISRVKQRDGSFDLTPLFIGSQGTLGIISEMVVGTEFYNSDQSVFVAAFPNPTNACDAADIISGFKPSALEFIDGEMFNAAREHNKKFIFDDFISDKNAGAVVYCEFSDFSAKSRAHKMKHCIKKLGKMDCKIYTSDEYQVEQLNAIREVSSVIIQPESEHTSYPSLIDGAQIPAERRAEFISAAAEFAVKLGVTMPLHIQWLNGVIRTRFPLQLHNIADKQKAFKVIADYAELVNRFGGCMITQSAEGRLKANGTYAQLDARTIEIYDQIKLAFDPFSILNPGVKQQTDLKTAVSMLNPGYNLGEVAKFSPRW